MSLPFSSTSVLIVCIREQRAQLLSKPPGWEAVLYSDSAVFDSSSSKLGELSIASKT